MFARPLAAGFHLARLSEDFTTRYSLPHRDAPIIMPPPAICQAYSRL